jgi:hypothetical protein
MKKTEYYVQIEGKEHGPLALAEIRQLLSDQIISNKTLIRNSNSDTFVCLDSIFPDKAAIKGQIAFSRTNIFVGISLIVLLISFFLYFKYNIENNKAEITAITEILNIRHSESSSVKKSLIEIEQNIKTINFAQGDVLDRIQKVESTAIRIANDYSLIKSTKDSIETLNRTVLDLKKSYEVNNEIVMNGLKNQISLLQSHCDTLSKDFVVIEREFQNIQKKVTTLDSYEKKIQELDKRIDDLETFNQSAHKILDNHQTKLNSHEASLKKLMTR